MSQAKYLIINADDFGLHTLVNQAVKSAHQEGVLTSTTLMSNGCAFEEAVSIAKDLPALGVGVHLTLVGGGASISEPNEVTSLVTKEGLFRDNYGSFIKNWIQGKIVLDEVYREWSLQIEKILQANIPISHLDGHQHLHVLPQLSSLVTKLAEQYQIQAIRIPKEPFHFFHAGLFQPTRLLARCGLTTLAILSQRKWRHLKSNDHFYGMLAGGQMTLDRWDEALGQLAPGISEIMTHPGLDSQHLNTAFPWEYRWQEEYQALKSKELSQWLSKYSVHLINYHDLQHLDLTNGG